MEQTFQPLPEDLNATAITENNDFELLILEANELWSFVGSKEYDQRLWLVMHSTTRQILDFHVGKRPKASGEALMAKLPTEIKKISFLRINLLLITRLSSGSNTVPLAKNLEGKDVQDSFVKHYLFLRKLKTTLG